ncbi:DUF2142 domain-containing protein [Zwartia sp.]|uniref:DUF2142 domain-containing protein n=1 Tax=Zwartia sp. TaxID=2978004 RepID=UPI003BB06744
MTDKNAAITTTKANSRKNIIFVALLFVVCNFLSTFIPPFQSPDEFEHVTRAYLFGKGVIVLEVPKDEVSGGFIDSGLARYMDVFRPIPFNPDRKISESELAAAKKIEWTGTTEFNRAPGMAFYFPAIYSIHALGLLMGEHLNLSVDATYKLTRALLLLAICGILHFSFQLYQPPYLVMALLVIPMSLFQLASASLDGIATAISIFLISAFLKITENKEQSAKWLFYTLMIAWLLLASSRVQQFSLILLVASCGYFMRKPRYFYLTILAALVVIIWQIIAVSTSVDGRVKLGAPTSVIVSWYLDNPLEFVVVLKTTLSSAETWRSYLSSFFGMLGWLDTPFVGKEYIYLLGLTALITLLSMTFRNLHIHLEARLLLVICSVGSILLIYFALLVTWTPHPAVVVHGVVGRYFLIPVIMLAYAFADLTVSANLKKQLCTLFLLILLGVFSVVNTSKLLDNRYFAHAK